jgi:hypothetical protein
MAEKTHVTRFGGGCAMLGVALAFASVAIGPMVSDPHDVPAVLVSFAEAPRTLHLHGLGVAVGTLLLLVGFAALASSMDDGPARPWARAGLAAAAVKTSVHLMGAVMGGGVLPTLSVQAVAAGVEASPAAAAAGAFYVLYEALLAPTFLALTLTALLFSRALIESGVYRPWLGWSGVVPAVWTGVGGVAFALAGPLGAAELLMTFIPGFMLSMVWVFAVGAVMWRVPPPAAAPRALPT